MKIRTLIAAFSLIVAVPAMQAADADVTATVAAQVKANPDNAAQIVAAAIAANPSLAPDIAAAAVKAAPGQAKNITAAAVKAAPNQASAISKAETQAVPAQARNIYTAVLTAANTALRDGSMSGGTYSDAVNGAVKTFIAAITGNFGTGGSNNIEIGEKVSATVSSPAS